MWLAVNSGLNCSLPCSFLSINALAIDPQDSNTLYALTIGKLFKSTNGGASWTAANSGLHRRWRKLDRGGFDPKGDIT